MGDVLARLADHFLAIPDGLAHLAILAGLILAIVNGIRFAIERSSVRVPAASAAPVAIPQGSGWWVRGWGPALFWPLVLVWTGFVVGSIGSVPWALVIGALIGGAVVLAIRLLRTWTAGESVAGSAIALVLTFSTVFLFGSLFVTRLNVARNPKGLFTGEPDLVGESFSATAMAVAAAPLVLLLALLAVRVLAAQVWMHQLWRSLGDYTFNHFAFIVTGLGGLTVVLYLAPKFGPGAPLAFYWFATPEFGRITYLLTLALILARYGSLYRRYASIRPGQSVSGNTNADSGLLGRSTKYVHVWAPLLLFGAVALCNGLRKDFGPLVPLFIATVATILMVVRQQAVGALLLSDGDSRERAEAEFEAVVKYPRQILVVVSVLGVIAVFAAIFTPDYVTKRFATWDDPWSYPWSTVCVPVPDGWAGPPDARVSGEDGTSTPIPFPEDSQPCLQSRQSVVYSGQSQVAQALAVMADGGLWGRGLSDTTSGRVPAIGLDLVLAAIWSKLGGIVVALLSVLLALLSYALIALGLSRRHGDGPGPSMSAAGIYSGALGWLILGQYLFQVVMTVNVFPHSGITAPLLSQGPQANMSLILGIISGVWAVYASTGRDPVRVDTSALTAAGFRRPRLPATAGILLVVLVLIAAITVEPYQGLPEDRAACAVAGLDADRARDPRVNPANCSTDLVAGSTNSMTTLLVDGRPTFEATASGWKAIPDGALALTATGGLLQAGAIEQMVSADAARSRAGGGLSDRLLPRPDSSESINAALTLDPAMQRAIAAASTTRGPDGQQLLPAGIAVVDGATGHVLTTVSAPSRAENAASDESESDTYSNNDPREDYNNATAGTWFVDGKKVDLVACEQAVSEGRLCARWQAERLTGAEPLEESSRIAYVGGDTTVRPPSDEVNRSFGTRLGLGSTFKVIIAATYLRGDGRSADDPIPAPTSVTYDGKTFRNYGGGECPGTVGGQITLREALAYSCNTAFIELAAELGWDSVRDTAEAFGFVGAGIADEPGAGLAGTSAGVASVVPEEASGAARAVDALGGGEVAGTPLRMASVMAAIANRGTMIQPTLIETITKSTGGTPSPVQNRSDVVSAEVAEQLRSALSATTAIGTATGLRAPDGSPVYVKTGTHEIVVDGEDTPAGQFERQIAWVAGFVGTVGFAVAVFTRDEQAGARRARQLAQTIIDQIVEE